MISRRIICLCVLLLGCLSVSANEQQREIVCRQALADHDVMRLFKQNTLKQLALEFGGAGLFVYDMQSIAVDDVLVRVEAYAKYPRPGQKELATMRVTGWVSRCQGTTIIRGNTWLADGTLKVARYAAETLKGKGLQWGKADAPQRFIVYVDSRCPHCHRLISYAQKLVESGAVFLDVRQVAYLEDVDAAIIDSRLSETGLVLGGDRKVSDDAYLEYLNGSANENMVEKTGAAYAEAREIIQTNTRTAKELLHVITVPAVLILEPEHNNQYRQMGYWEINRIFQ
jgi:glutaredoxin